MLIYCGVPLPVGAYSIIFLQSQTLLTLTAFIFVNYTDTLSKTGTGEGFYYQVKVSDTKLAGGTRVTGGGLHLSKFSYQIIYFGWLNGHWFYKQRTDTRMVVATDMDGAPSMVELFEHTVHKNSVGVL